MTESVGFQYWKDSSMLLGVSSKNQEKIKDDWESLMKENKFYLRKMEKMKKKMKEMEEELEKNKKKKKPTDPRITVTREEDVKEYNRQYGYIARNPDCERVPPRKYALSEQRKDRNLAKDPRITVTRKEDPAEHTRQYCYLAANPDCEVIPPRARTARGGDNPDKRITVQRREDKNEYQRQFRYIKRNPNCKRVPEIGGERTGPKGKEECPYEKNDPRFTVRFSEDPQEYNRQRHHLRNHPDCEKIPERSKKKHTKYSIKKGKKI